MTSDQKSIFFVVNTPEFFLSHRMPVALAAKNSGYDVHVISTEGKAVENIRKAGFQHHVIGFARSGQNPLVDLRILMQLIILFRRQKPDLVHLVTIKPVLYGGLASRIVGVRCVVAAVSGLGTVFVSKSLLARSRKWLITHLYAMAFHQKRLAVIFQNLNDRDILMAKSRLHLSETRVIRGSGVALVDFPRLPEPEVDRIVVVMVSRLLKDKGVLEFVEAARILRGRKLNVEMRLIGSSDQDNLSSVTQRDLNQWEQEDVVKILGYRQDIAEQYAAANIVCLPSYREGLPKSLVEAAACGRAIVTTDVPGCRDAITADETGLLVPVKDPRALADAIQKLIENPGLRKRMGKKGRALAEEAFAIEKIVDQHLKIYEEVLDGD